MFQSLTVTIPAAMASFRRLWARYPWKRSGNRVTTSNRIAAAGAGTFGPLALRGAGGLCGLRGLGLLELLHVLLEQHCALLARLRPNALPVLDPARLERHPLVGVL